MFIAANILIQFVTFWAATLIAFAQDDRADPCYDIDVMFLILFNKIWFGVPMIILLEKFIIDDVTFNYCEMFAAALIALIMQSYTFEAVHQVFHHWRILSNLHDVHHRFKQTRPHLVFYSHPLEFVATIVFPSIYGIWIASNFFRAARSSTSMTIVLFVGLLRGMYTHCGAFRSQPLPHDMHHLHAKTYIKIN
jgi:sterol desaturase/sphingolipid hydroxylase (fatty acid hydroxylase superfamily)